MERLTWRRPSDNAVCPRVPKDSDKKWIAGEFTQEVYNRLADYEDTGYSPLEIKSLEGEWNAARTVVDSYRSAEEQGLLVRLPCKVGDVLYVTDEGTTLPAVRRVETITWRNGKVSIECVNQRTGAPYHCAAEDFGKTVFVTREEAEAALKEDRTTIIPASEEMED